MAATDIVTLAEWKAYMGASYTTTANDTQVQAFIAAVSKLVENYLGCALVATTATNLTLDGSGERRLYLPQWPVTSIGTVTEDDEALTKGGDSADFYLLDDIGVLLRANGQVWADVPDNVVISTITAGYAQASVPADIKLQAYIEVALRWQEAQGKHWGLQSRSVKDGNVAFIERGDLLPATKAVLDRYRRVRI